MLQKESALNRPGLKSNFVPAAFFQSRPSSVCLAVFPTKRPS
jgi:hypothetical protein